MHVRGHPALLWQYAPLLNSQHMFTASVTLKGVNSKFTTSFKSLVIAKAHPC